MVKGDVRLAKLGTLSLLYISVFLVRIGFGAIIIIFPLYVQAGPAVTAIVTALYPAMEGLSAIPAGAYVDQEPLAVLGGVRNVAEMRYRFRLAWLRHNPNLILNSVQNLIRGRRRAFIGGMILVSILTFVIGLSNNLYIVGIAHGLAGLAAALITISSLTMITDLTVEQNRGTGMGAFNLSTLAGYGVGILLGVVFTEVFASTLGDSFVVVSCILAAATGFAYLGLTEPARIGKEHWTIRKMYHNLTGDVAAIIPIWFSLTVVLGSELFIPKLVKNAGSDIAQSSPLILLGLVVLGAGAVLFGRLSDRVGRTMTMQIGVAGEVGFLLIFPSIFQKLVLVAPGTPWLATYEQIGPIIIVAGLLFFLGSALLPSVLASMADKATLGFRGAAMGLYSLLLSLGVALGTVLAGFADQLAGVQGVFFSSAVIFAGLSLTSGILLHRENH